MRILPRLRYLVEVSPLTEAAVLNSLHVLQRIVQHNLEMAYEVFKLPGLVQSLVGLLKKERNMVEVMRVFRFMFVAGKNMAYNVVRRFLLFQTLKQH